MKKLLIIADDFGLSESVNKGIFECCENNIVTGVSVMSTGAAFDDIHYLIEKYPNIDIGLHFDLISTRLLSDLQINYSPINLAIRLNFDKKLLEAIRKELILQINKLMKITQIKHIDSHRHIHYIPQIFKIVNDIADELAIARVRVPCPKIKFNGLKFMFYRRDFFKFLPFFIFKFFNKTNAASTDDFFGLFQVGNLTEEYLDYIFDSDFEYAEFMIHPGYVDDDLKKTNENLLYRREAELKLLLKYFTQKHREDKFIAQIINKNV